MTLTGQYTNYRPLFNSILTGIFLLCALWVIGLWKCQRRAIFMGNFIIPNSKCDYCGKEGTQ